MACHCMYKPNEAEERSEQRGGQRQRLLPACLLRRARVREWARERAANLYMVPPHSTYVLTHHHQRRRRRRVPMVGWGGVQDGVQGGRR